MGNKTGKLSSYAYIDGDALLEEEFALRLQILQEYIKKLPQGIPTMKHCHSQLTYRSGIWNDVRLFLMTRTQAARVVEAHMRRRHREGHGGTSFLCVETSELCNVGHISAKHAASLKDYVNGRISPFYTASEWAERNGRLPVWRDSSYESYPKGYSAQRLQQELEIRCELLQDYIKDCS